MPRIRVGLLRSQPKRRRQKVCHLRPRTGDLCIGPAPSRGVDRGHGTVSIEQERAVETAKV